MQSCIKSCWKHPRTELHPRQQDLLWFQQYGTTVHSAEFSMQVLRTIFPGRLISPSRLTMQYQTTSSRVTLQAQYTKHVLPILLKRNSEFWSVFRGSPRKGYNVLYQHFYRDCRSELNDMVVTYKVSYSNNND